MLTFSWFSFLRVAVDLDARVRKPSSVAYTRGGKLNALLGGMIVSGLY